MAETKQPRRPDSQQLVRQWALLRLLSDAKGAYSVKELAEQLGTSKATIERDLATLEHDFAVIEETVGKQKKAYRIDQKIRALETLHFGTSELLALYAAESTLASLAGTPLHDDLHAVMLKIRGVLSPRHNGGLTALASVFVPHARGYVDYSQQHEQIDTLTDAIARRLVCDITYSAASKGGVPRQHRARPLRLVWHNSALYLLTCLGDHTRITTLAVHRIGEITITKDVFSTPAVDVEAHMTKAYGIFVSEDEQDVEIRFSSEIAARLEERTFHPNEHKERLADGSLVYRIRSSAQWELIPWVQSFGPLAELVTPLSWRAALAANAAATLARYTQPVSA